jgi:hypothetical protein
LYVGMTTSIFGTPGPVSFMVKCQA